MDALTTNTTLLLLDLRLTGCTPELMHCAHTLLARNRQQANVDVSCDVSCDTVIDTADPPPPDVLASSQSLTNDFILSSLSIIAA